MAIMEKQYDKFYAKIWRRDTSFVVTIPANLVKYAGFEEGELVAIYIKKEQKEKKGDTNEQEKIRETNKQKEAVL